MDEHTYKFDRCYGWRLQEFVKLVSQRGGGMFIKGKGLTAVVVGTVQIRHSSPYEIAPIDGQLIVISPGSSFYSKG